MFPVTRYGGIEEQTSVTPDKAKSILEKLNERAKKRKLARIEQQENNQLDSTVVGEKNNDDITETPVKKKSKTGDLNSQKKKTSKKKKLASSKLLKTPLTKIEKQLELEDEKIYESGNESFHTPQKSSIDDDEEENDSEYETAEDETSSSTGAKEERAGAEENSAGTNEIGGYTVIGSLEEEVKPEVARILPHWLSTPKIIDRDISSCKVALDDADSSLTQEMKDTLKKHGITHLFPVQNQIIPEIMKSIRPTFYSGLAGYRPHDICCSSPTGSGKTLAFVLPIVQALKTRVACRLRALVVLPVQELARQVYQVFMTYTADTKLKVCLIGGANKSLIAEQRNIIHSRTNESLADILVTTAGRLVDHMLNTEGFNVSYLRYLVIDEADRMMDYTNQDWLQILEDLMLKQLGYDKKHNPFHQPITAANCSNRVIPVQKLLFSATLSHNPEKLQQLNLFMPRLFTSVVVDENKTESNYVGKYTTPVGLKEYYIDCKVDMKPIVILHLLHTLHFTPMLIFSNSRDTVHRLSLTLQLCSDDLNIHEFTSDLRHKRAKILQQFKTGKIDVLVCSDAMTRGIDIDNVKYVVSYEAPQYLTTYTHRVGRAARAGKQGTAITLLEKKQVKFFKGLFKEGGKVVNEMMVHPRTVQKFVPRFKKILPTLQNKLENEKESKRSNLQPRRKSNNNKKS
ncbi:ATP-dependent RNA helicase DDX51-like [Tubulanus polymorphus]|uniref:ATP-dependent RNA helicase DDX51-like n=1 Tax=Tubulanus polymorphus TaxID=672921 RepID=UPI003DA2BA13